LITTISKGTATSGATSSRTPRSWTLTQMAINWPAAATQRNCTSSAMLRALAAG
jgi:hypothetical protein